LYNAHFALHVNVKPDFNPAIVKNLFQDNVTPNNVAFLSKTIMANLSLIVETAKHEHGQYFYEWLWHLEY